VVLRSGWGWDEKIQLCETLRVDERIDLGDLAVGDGKGHHREQPFTGGYHGSCRSVDERGGHEREELRVGGRVRRDGFGAAKCQGGFLAQRAAIDAELDSGIEYRDERVEVAVAGSREERVDHLSLSREISVGFRAPLHASPRAAGELLRGGLGAVKNGRDVCKRDGEYVVQDEREPLGWTQRVKYHQQR